MSAPVPDAPNIPARLRRSVDLFFGFLVPFMAISIIGAVGLYAMMHDSLTVRTVPWGASADCPTRLLMRNPGSPQTLILGTSRTMQGISADHLAAAFTAPPGSVINLASNGRATDLQYLIAEELAHTGRLRRVIVELSVGSHASDAFLAQSREAGAEIGSGATYIQSEAAMIFASWRQRDSAIAGLPMMTRWHEHAQISLRRFSSVTRSAMRATARRASLFVTPPSLHDPLERFGCRQRSNPSARLASPPAMQLDSSGDYFLRHATLVDRRNYRRLVTLGSRRGFDVVFVRMVDRFSPADAEGLPAMVKTELGADLLMPPLTLVAQLRERHFADTTHFDRAGARLFSNWLAAQLLARDQQLRR